MVDTGAIRTVIGSKSVQNFKPDPYIATILNCGMWSIYGMPFVTEDNTLVVTINGFGFFLEIFYALIFFVYSTWSKRRKIILIFLGELVFLAVVIFLIMTFLHSAKQRKVIVGPICIVFNILMYFAPLTVMIPNGIGTVSGLVQLILYAMYYRTTKWDEEIDSV
ncbi:hypothetical protein JHK82_011705 [Glycine max]|nr:hypothetical protein JHK86_011693 [Glycine max]KAG5153736.1 hypothetical protein JHK82_011705 [Glycine max]